MFSSFLVVSRESFEAIMIIAIVLGFLNKTRQFVYKKYVWVAVGLGFSMTAGATYYLNLAFGKYTHGAEGYLGGSTLIVSSLFILTMVAWMAKTGGSAGRELRNNVETLVSGRKIFGLIFLISTAILREGIETLFFLLSVANGQSPLEMFTGSVLGLLSAIVLGYLIVKGSVKLNMKVFFQTFSYLLVVIAAGFFAHGIKKLQSVHKLPVFIYKMWDSSWLLDKHSLFGGFVKGMFTYDPKPSLLSIVAYAGFIAVGVLMHDRLQGKAS